MSKCSAAEIAEKRRIAIEKLNAKKKSQQQQIAAVAQKSATSTSSNNNSYNTATNRNEFNVQTPPPTPQQNSFNSALEALKKSVKFPQSNNARMHPYQRPPQSSTGTSNGGGDKNPFRSKTTTTSETNKQLAPVFYSLVTCKLHMISQDQFVVTPSAFHSKLIDVFKTIPSRIYNSETRLWSFALKDYDLLQQNATVLKPHVVLGTIPKSVRRLCFEPIKEQHPSCLVSIETRLEEKLLPFQKDGVCFAIAHQGRAMICDEMGLGKTYQALAVADFYKEDWPLLICTTASTRDTWATQVRSLLPSVPVHRVEILCNNQQYIGDAKVLITSYNMMERHVNMLAERKFGFLIFDESHTLKNSKAKCTAVADRLASQARRVILLSGTPALSRPVELFSQLQMIDKKFMNFMEFTTRYCNGKQSNFGWDANGQSNLQELNVILRLKFMIRRTKADVALELSEKSRETVLLDPALVWHSNDSQERLGKFAKDFSASKGRDKEEILLKFYQTTAEVKSRAVCSYVKGLVKEKIKFIVFAHHRVMMDAIEECLLKLGIDFIRIDGSTRSDLRAEYIDHFQNSIKCQVALLSLKACNAGITLTAAEMIIFAELDWNPSTLAQAESRAHRIGQDKHITCRYLMAAKTADDIIWNMLKSKQDVLNRAGIFCEDLQEAKATAAPISSNTIDHYFSPDKSNSNIDNKMSPNTSMDEEKPTTSKQSINSIGSKVKNNDMDKKSQSNDNNNKDNNANIPDDIEALFEDDDELIGKNQSNLKSLIETKEIKEFKSNAKKKSDSNSNSEVPDNIEDYFKDEDDDSITSKLIANLKHPMQPKEEKKQNSVSKNNAEIPDNIEDFFTDEDEELVVGKGSNFKTSIESKENSKPDNNNSKEIPNNIDELFEDDMDDAFIDLL